MDFDKIGELEVNKEYTILFQNDFGFVSDLRVNVSEVEFKKSDYGSDLDSVKLVFKQKRQRKNRQLRFTRKTKFAIFPGHVDLDTEIFGDSEVSPNGCLISKSKYLSFDSRYFSDALNSTNELPILINSGI